ALVDVDGRARVARRHLVDLVGEVGRDADGAEAAPHADAEPVLDVVLETPAEQDRPAILAEELERRARRDLEPPLTIEPQVPHCRRARERTGQLDLLRLRLA